MLDIATRWTADALVTGSAQGAVAIALVWFVCRRLSRLPASVQAWLWWAAALKMVLALAPVPPISVPILPPASALAAILQETPAPSAPMSNVAPGVERLASERTQPVGGTSNAWLVALVGSWFVVVAVQALRLARSYRRLREVVHRSVPLSDEDAAVVGRLASAVGLPRVPRIRGSEEIDAPQVVGLRRPIVLVPSRSWKVLSADDRMMALGHELMHVRRRDLALGWVPALAERLFFFHPLARLAAREYLTAREAACDAEVLRALDVSANAYGRLLVRLGIADLETAFSAGGVSSSASSLKGRLDMLAHASSGGASRVAMGCLAAALVVAVLPFELVAGTTSGQEAAPAATASPESQAGGATVRAVPLAVSPDGKWQAFVSKESGAPELYVRPVPAASARNGQATPNQPDAADKAGVEAWKKWKGAVVWYDLAVGRAYQEALKAGGVNSSQQLKDVNAAIQALMRQTQEMAVQQQKLAETLRQLSTETARISSEIGRAMEATAQKAK
jgi:beta-lactamase regulating signal transducer with metallopeptidase domain